MKFDWSRRAFLVAAGAAALPHPRARAAAAANREFAVEFPKPGPYEARRRYIMPGEDDYQYEKQAMDFEMMLGHVAKGREIPLAPGFEGVSPNPVRWRAVDEEFATAEYNGGDFVQGFAQWKASLGELRRLRFIVLADYIVRIEAAGRVDGRLYYRVGHWRMEWRDDALYRFRPLEETRATRAQTAFQDCSEALLGGSRDWRDQLVKGTPYWRSRLDSATGIDIYGSQGISAGDMNNDGWDEIYVSQPGGLPNRLFARQPDGTYRDIAREAGVDLLDDTSCALFVDFRNAGLQDLLVLASGGPLYFVNLGNSKFRLNREAFRFDQALKGTFTSMSACDFDRDGKVDLFLCTYVYFQSEDKYQYPVPYHDAQVGPPNYLLRNRLNADGSGSFEDVTDATGMNHNNNRYSFSAVWCDYDNSGWPSLYIANDFGRNNLYRNRNGKFHDVAAEAGVEDMGPGMCANWMDFDGDLKPDLYVSNMWTPAGQRVVRDPHFPLADTPEMKDGYRRHTKGNSLYRNRGDGTFEEIPDAGGAAVGKWAWASEGVDFDNDGVPEIATCSGMVTNSRTEDVMSFFWRHVVAESPRDASPSPEYEVGWNSINQYIREEYSWNGREPNSYFVRRSGEFRDYSGLSGFDFPEDSRTYAITDFDDDGNLDFFLKSRLGPQVRTLRNQCGTSRRSIAFDLRGVKSNRDAIGATVEIRAGEHRWKKSLVAGSGYLSQHTKRLFFGVGDAAKIDEVKVVWPSGAEQTFRNLDTGCRYLITEGANEPRRTPFQKRREIAVTNLMGDNSVSLSPTWLVEPVPIPEKRKGPGFLLLTDGQDAPPSGVPVETLNLAKAASNLPLAYTVFRRYLFDWRAPLTVPMLILLNSDGYAAKIYPGIPASAELRADLAAVAEGSRRALPFPGTYIGHASRNFYKLGAAFLGVGLLDEALPYLEAALRQWPDNYKALLAIGQTHLEAERYAEARKSLERALALNPNSPETLNNLGGVAIGEGRNADALAYFERLLKIAPHSAYGLTNAGLALSKLDRRQEAEKLYRRALELDPKDGETMNRLGQLVGQQGRLDDAIALFKKSLEIDPKSAPTLNNLAVAYMQSGKVNDAVAALQYGVRVAPTYETLYLNLARIFVGQGNRERARETLRQLLERVPESRIAQRALQQLGEP